INTAHISNKGGVAGAYVADFLLTVIGYLAYLVPVSLLMQAIRLLKSRHQETLNGALFALQLLGGLLVMFAGSSLLSLYVPAFSAVPASSGGLLGGWLAELAGQVFGHFGAVLILFAALLVGLTLTINISWTELARFACQALWQQLQQGYRLVAQAASQSPLQGSLFKNISQPVLETTEPGAQPPQSGPKTAVPDMSRQNTPAESANPPLEALPLVRAPKVLKPQRIKKRKAKPKILNDGLPGLELLDPPAKQSEQGYSDVLLQEMSVLLETKLADFNIDAKVEAVLPGPVVTRFEIQPSPGTKVSRITNLAKDLARSLAVISVRVVEVIPGKTVVGIEIPNQHREMIRLSEVVGSDAYDNSASPATICLGKDIAGYPVVAELNKMPHLLVAGTTGSGKSVGLNAMLMSMLLKSSPQELRMIMVDPKMLELSVYDDIPHLLTPVVTDMKEAANALRWCVAEMERRYRLMAAMGVRNLAGFNRKVRQAIANGEPIPDPIWQPEEGFALDEPQPRPSLEPLPVIVVVIDEFADMMMIVGKKVEELIARIAQKARAAGIHLILATQRPSVDVITGLIKANVPARIAFQVSSKIDSRTILDQGGAEQLLGHGDMLYLPPGTGLPVRVHGAFISDEEVPRVCDDWRARGEPA
ncbi:MAG: DNA translocase FtsK 4TM domain-containing protein, partial [Pseudomonadota bacterium]